MQFKRTASVDVQLSQSQRRFKIENLRISFSVTKTFTATSNVCDVKIYNLSSYTRGLFHELGDQITVNAGYEGDEGEQVLFVADTRRVYHQYNVPEFVTNLEGLDSNFLFPLQTIQGSFTGPVKATDVLRYICKQLDIQTIQIPSSVEGVFYYQKFVYSGPASDPISRLCDYLGLDWSIQDKLLTLTIRGSFIQEPPIFISADTGLIFFPEVLKDIDYPVDPISGRLRIGWRIRTLLNPRIKPRSRIQLYSQKTPELNGTYTAETVRHIGDTHANQWETLVDMVQT